MDMIDAQIVHAVAAFSSSPSASDLVPDEQAIWDMANEQDRYDQVLSAYLAGAISLARAAELLGLSVIDLRFRLVRLDVPLRLGAATQDEVMREIAQAVGQAQKINR